MRNGINNQHITTAQRSRAAVAAIASVRAEGLEPSLSTRQRLDRYVQGEITVSKLRHDTLNEAKAIGVRAVLR
jgi:hypothetical protein